MTLDTTIKLKAWTDPETLHGWVCQELLGAPGARRDVNEKSIWNAPGQGLPAWFGTDHNGGDPEEFVSSTMDAADLAMEREWFGPTGYLTLSFDTSYGYRDERGRGCSELHADYVVRLAAHLAERGIGIWWRNEFTGEWHDGIEGLDQFADNGTDAQDWFRNVAAPAIAAHINNNAEEASA